MTRFTSNMTDHNKLRQHSWSTKSRQGLKPLTVKQRFKLECYLFLDPYRKPKTLAGSRQVGSPLSFGAFNVEILLLNRPDMLYLTVYLLIMA